MSDHPPPTPRELLQTGLIAAAVLLLASVVFFGPGVATGSELFFTHDVTGSDFWHNNYPARQFYAEELAAGRLPLWSPRMGGGFPLHAAAEVGALYPPNLVLFTVLPLACALNWSILLNFILAGVFAAMYARQLGANRGASTFVAVTFALSGFFLVHLKHPAMAASGAWAPLILLLLERHANSRSTRSLVTLAIAVAASMLGSHSQIAYNTLLVAGLYAVWLVVRVWRSSGVAPAAGFGLGSLYAVALGVVLSAPQILPTVELNETGLRQGGMPIKEATFSGYSWRHLKFFVNPTANGDPGTLRPVSTKLPSGEPVQKLEGFRGNVLFWEVSGYVGIVALLLCGAGIWLGRRRESVQRSTFFLLFTLLLALGSSGGLFYVFYYVVPWFDHFRFHGRFLLFVDLWIAVLAGLGLTLLLQRLAPNKAGVAAIAATVLTCVGFFDVRHGLGDHNPTVEAEPWLTPPDSARAIFAREKGRSQPFRIFTSDPALSVFQNAYYRAYGWTGDLQPYEPAQRMLDANLSSLYGLNHLELFAPIFPRWCRDVTNSAWLPPDPRTKEPRGLNHKIVSAFNVRYVLDPIGVMRGKMPSIGRFDGDTLMARDLLIELKRYQVVLHENPDVMPRAFLVPDARWIEPGQASEVDALKSSSFRPRQLVVLVRDGQEPVRPAVGVLSEPIEAPVEIVAYEPQRVVLKVDAPRDCWLFLSDTWYPGWRARIGSDEKRIWRANVAGRAIELPRGQHEVVFTYEPASFRNGLWAALVAAVLLGTLGLQRRLIRARQRPLER